MNTGIYPAEFYVPEDDPSAIYYDYFTSSEVMFPVWLRDDTFDPKAVVVGLAIDEAAKAYAVRDLQAARLVNDTIGGQNVVVVASPNSRAGRIYQRNGLTFAPAEPDDTGQPPSVLLDDAGARWTVTEEALVAEADPTQTLPRIPSITSFWFGWYQYHPDTEIYQP